MSGHSRQGAPAGAAGRIGACAAVAVAALAFGGAPRVRAQDAPKAIDLAASAAWKAGETVTETGAVTTTVAVTSPDDASLAVAPETTSFEWTLVRRCEAAGEDGRPSAAVVHLRSWLAKSSAGEDRSLADALVHVRRDGWSVLRASAEPTPLALAWLAGACAAPGSPGDAAAADLASAAPVAPAAKWKPAAEGAAARLLLRGGVPDWVRGVEAACEASDFGGLARVEYRIVPVVGDPAPGGILTGECTGALEGTPGAWRASGRETSSATFELTTTAQGVRTVRRAECRLGASRAAGGEMPPGKPSLWLVETGIERALRGEHARAVEAFAAAAEADPLSAAAFLGMGRSKAALRDFEGAIDDLSHAIELDPRSAEIFTARGLAHWAASDAESAIADFTSAVKADPALAAPWFHRGVAFAAQREYDRAVEDLTKALELTPGDAKAWYQRGGALNLKGDADGAIRDFTKAVEIDPSYAAAWNNRGNAKDQKGDTPGAIADYTRAVEAEPRFTGAWFNRGRARASIGEFEGAVEDCTRAIELDPSYGPAWNTRGNCRSEAGDHEGAAADWTKALEIDPRHWQAHFSMARIRFQPGLPAQPVIDALRTAIPYARDQDYPRLWLWLARARNGEEKAATDELNSYVAGRRAAPGPEWYPVLVALLTGKMLEATALGESMTADPKESAGRLCEATFFAGMRRYFGGDVPNAVALFDRSIATNVRTYIEYAEAKRWRAAVLLGATTQAIRAADDRPSGARPGSVRIVSPDPKGAAAIAGLQDGDVVSKVGGATAKPGHLDDLLAKSAPGTKVKLEVLRKGRRVQAEVTLGALRR